MSRLPKLKPILVPGVLASFIVGCCFLRSPFRQEIRPLTYWTDSQIPASWITPITQAHTSWNPIWNMFTYGGSTGDVRQYTTDGVNAVFIFAHSDPLVLALVGVQDLG